MKSSFLVYGLALSVSAFGASAGAAEKQVVEVQALETGFTPKQIDVKPGIPVTLNVTRKTEDTCWAQIQVPSKKIKVDLPVNKTVSLDLGKLEKGEIKFGCGMNMMDSGKILVK